VIGKIDNSVGAESVAVDRPRIGDITRVARLKIDNVRHWVMYAGGEVLASNTTRRRSTVGIFYVMVVRLLFFLLLSNCLLVSHQTVVLTKSIAWHCATVGAKS
jgi:hypothetical protein